MFHVKHFCLISIFIYIIYNIYYILLILEETVLGKIISIVNQKGGVGKTSCTLNIGAGLANERRRVLYVDADPQGNLSTLRGVL